jgi:hypothetical protein
LRQISHHILEEFFEFFFALFERGEVDSERFLRAQRFAWTSGSTGRSVSFIHAAANARGKHSFSKRRYSVGLGRGISSP